MEQQNKGTKEQRNKGTKEKKIKGTKKQKCHPIGSGITRSPGLVFIYICFFPFLGGKVWSVFVFVFFIGFNCFNKRFRFFLSKLPTLLLNTKIGHKKGQYWQKVWQFFIVFFTLARGSGGSASQRSHLLRSFCCIKIDPLTFN